MSPETPEPSTVPDPDEAERLADEADRAHRRKTASREAIFRGGGMIVAVTLTAFLVRLLMGGKPAHASWAVQLLLGIVTVVGICWGAYQRYKLWTLPVRRLGTIAEKVRKGQLPLDELAKIDGVPGMLVPIIRDLLMDLRRHRQQLQQLEKEMNQRVANRTDALERALGSLREKASRDVMTGLYNRRMLDESLPKLIEQSLQKRRPLAVLMIDVDYFKQLNDTLGHAAGDELLRSIGQIIRSTARASDLAFRAGGDEFVVLMPEADQAAGEALADRLVSLVAALAKTLDLEKRPGLSIGMAQLREIRDPTAAKLLEHADQALYEIKRARKRGAGGANLSKQLTLGEMR